MLNKLIAITTLVPCNITLSSIGNLCGSKLINVAIAPTSGKGVIAQLRNNLAQLDAILERNNLSTDNILRTQIFTKNLKEAEQIQTELTFYFGGKTAAFSIIPQPPAFGEECLMEVQISELIPNRINNNISILKFENTEWAFLSGVKPTKTVIGPYNEATSVFQQANVILEQNGFSFGQVARTWIYQKNIIAVDDSIGENYQNMNNARAAFFKDLSFKIGNPDAKSWNGKVPPASTGIDMADGSILLELVAIKTTDPSVQGQPVTNPFQTNPFKYHETSLQLGEDKKTQAPPAFSRGFSVITPRGETLLVSGTASVEYEAVIHKGNVAKQTELSILNMKRVAEQRNMSLEQFFSTRAYIAKPKKPKRYSQKDFEIARDTAHDIVRKNFPNTPCLFVRANVCRIDWLFEIEAWAGATRID
jgi:enamine deaminase RidA (YjgF/YER057c/UK114 family)